MKVGILTFFNAHNYGAVLQAYALKNYISNLGYDCTIINYRNKYIDRAYPPRLKPRIRKKNYLNPKFFHSNIKELRIWLYSRKSWKVQYQKFENFINRYLLDGKTENWKEQINECDLLLFGSDQIWEKNITGPNDKVFIGDFETNAKKVSYAASCYSEQSAIDEHLLRSLRKFHYISVRENKLAEILKKGLNNDCEIEVVMDPVFLPDESIYHRLSQITPDTPIPYVLFYMVSENKELSKMSEYLRKECGKRVIEVHYYKSNSLMLDWQRADVGPEEFLSLIRNADYVFTNSFHGTAFSLILHKQFVVVNNNIRILNLLKAVDLEKRAVLNLEALKNTPLQDINYHDEDKKLKELIEKSRIFLKKALLE